MNISGTFFFFKFPYQARGRSTLATSTKAKRNYEQVALITQPPSLFVLKQFNQFLFVLPVKYLLKSCHECIILKSG